MARQDSQLGKSSRLIVVAAVCVFIAALYFGRDLLIPMALAILATFVLFPVVQQLEKWGFNRAAATVMVVSSSLSVLAGIGYVVSSQAESVWKERFPGPGPIFTTSSGVCGHFLADPEGDGGN